MFAIHLGALFAWRVLLVTFLRYRWHSSFRKCIIMRSNSVFFVSFHRGSMKKTYGRKRDILRGVHAISSSKSRPSWSAHQTREKRKIMKIIPLAFVPRKTLALLAFVPHARGVHTICERRMFVGVMNYNVIEW